jgi:S-adenosylmethionine decarboxylase
MALSGCEWVVEAHGCDAASLADLGSLRAFFDRLIGELELNVIGETHWHQFPGSGGITGLSLLAESHLACHTFPEYGSLCLNLFCCRPRQDFDFYGALRDGFGATGVHVRRLERPYGAE